MSDTVLAGNWTVHYLAEARQKRIEWTGPDSDTNTVNELYSALQDLFDELTQMDDGVPMSAQTPTEYTIGIIDAGDSDPWFIDHTSVEHLTDSALQTANWDRVQDSNTGIVKIEYTVSTTDFVAGDIGKPVVNTDLDTGTLLDFNTTLSPKVAYIRPTNNTVTHNWDSTAGVVTVTAGSGNVTQSLAAVSAGESLWANIYSIGALESMTHLYIYQEGAYLTAYKDTSDWWTDKTTVLAGGGSDHIDILVNISDLGDEIDEGWIKVYARQYGKTYSYYSVDLTSGGRNPIPLQTGADLDNTTGFRTMTLLASAANYDVGNFIYDTETGTKTWATTTKRGVITAVDTNDITYYLIGEPITDFVASDTVIQEYTGTADDNGTGTIDGTGPVPDGPSTGTLPVINFGELATGGSYDVDEDGTTEDYSIVIDCSAQALTRVYEWTKYITRRDPSATDIDPDGGTVIGEEYLGADYRISGYTSETGQITTDTVVTQATSAAEGTVVNHNTTDNILILRASRGTFSQGASYDITGGGQTIVTTGATLATITPIGASPFGTFAGGKFFCAPGIYLLNYLGTDLNNFQLVDDTGTVYLAPIKVDVTVNQTITNDRIAVFRLDGLGGDIEKDYYSCVGGESIGGNTIVVNEAVRVDEPGKTAGGVLRLVDDSANQEYRIPFDSWNSATKTFNLDETTGLTSNISGNTPTHIEDTGAFASAKIGDLIRRTANDAIGYITAIDDNDNADVTTITDFTNSDGYEINVVPVVIEATNDTIYLPFIDIYETTGSVGSEDSEAVQIVYSGSTVYTRVRARHSTAAPRMIPFEQDSSIGSSGMTVSVIRTADTIYTP